MANEAWSEPERDTKSEGVSGRVDRLVRRAWSLSDVKTWAKEPESCGPGACVTLIKELLGQLPLLYVRRVTDHAMMLERCGEWPAEPMEG